MAPMRLDYSKRIIALVTGTNSGIGKATAIQLGMKLVSGSKLITITNIANIPEKVEILGDMKTKNPEVYFDVHMKDLSNVDVGVYSSIMDKFIQHPALRERHYEYGLIIHNAGSLGEIDVTGKLQNIEKWRKYYDLNFFSPTLLNSIFVGKCKPYTKHIFVVNITSMFSVRPQAKLSMYCSGKAARNAYFSSLAAEDANVSVMNYSPGSVETDMYDEAQRQRLSAKKGDVVLLSPDEATCKMLDTLATGNYTSGSLFDYYGRSA